MLLRPVVELLSVATLLSFLASATLNQLAFAHEGVSFLELATTEDIIREGLRALFAFLLTMLAMFPFAVSTAFATEATSNMRQGSPETVKALIAAVIMLVFFNVTGELREQGSTRFFWSMAGVCGALGALIALAALAVLFMRLNRAGLRPWRPLRRIARTVGRRSLYIGTFSAAVAGTVISAEVAYFSKVNDLRHGVGLVLSLNGAPPIAGIVGYPTLVWAGAARVIMRCESSYYMVGYPENIVVARYPASTLRQAQSCSNSPPTRAEPKAQPAPRIGSINPAKP